MKKKVLIIAIMFMLISVTGITYSLYTNMIKKDIPISLASFSVGVEKKASVDIDLSDLEPGSVNRYDFSILNNINENMSDVSIAYNIILYSESVKNDYSLEVVFPDEYSEEEYSGLVDYINLTIEASQKIK